MNKSIDGKLFKDGRNVTHCVLTGFENRRVGGVDIETECGLRYNVIPKVSLRKRGNVDCMGCLVKSK